MLRISFFLTLFIGFGLTSYSFADDLFDLPGRGSGDDPWSETVISFNAGMFKVDDDLLKRAAAKAFMARGWTIEKIEQNFVTGKISRSVGKIDISKFPTIEIGFLKGDRKKWLLNLKKDFLVELVACDRSEMSSGPAAPGPGSGSSPF